MRCFSMATTCFSAHLERFELPEVTVEEAFQREHVTYNICNISSPFRSILPILSAVLSENGLEVW